LPSPRAVARTATGTAVVGVLADLGRYRLSKLHAEDVQRAMDQVYRTVVRFGRLISPGPVYRIRAVLRSALSEARRLPRVCPA
jgi:hypothetical protein